MVSGGTVTGDLSSLKSCFSNYYSEVNGLSGGWKGLSHDNLVSKFDEFFTEYSNVIDSEMSAFASACQLYVEYDNAKQNYNISVSNYNQAVANKDSRAMTTYGNQRASYSSKITQLKGQIESLLATAKATSLQASSTSSSGLSTSFTAGKSLGLSAGTYEYTFTSSMGKEMKYYLYIPNNATEGMPLILYLHGDGSVNNMSKLKDGEMSHYVKNLYGDDFPFIYIQPMTEVTSWTKNNRLDTLSELVTNVASEYHCDSNKIILTGMSRGGNGTWALANAYPNLFSCFVPVSGHSNVDASNLTNLPVMAISTPDGSDSWNYGPQKKLVDEINAAGGNATFVSKDGYTHNSVSGVTYTEDLFNWMISQTKSNKGGN